VGGRAELERLKRRALGEQREKDEEVSSLKTQLTEVQHRLKQASEKTGQTQLEARLSQLSNSLLEKQESLNISTTELTALRGRFQAEQQRRIRAEHALQQQQQHDGPGGGFDLDSVEAGGPAHSLGSGGSRIRHRGGGARAISKLTPIAKNQKLARAVDQLDRFAMDTGNFLKNEPVARLFFLIYLIMLHMWALAILVWHSHQIEKMHADTGHHMRLPGT